MIAEFLQACNILATYKALNVLVIIIATAVQITAAICEQVIILEQVRMPSRICKL
jgi:hypothetical protein